MSDFTAKLSPKSFDWRSRLETFYEKIGNIKRKQRLLISFGTIFLLGGAFIALVYIPKNDKAANAVEDVSRLERQLMTVKIKAKKIHQFRDEHAKVLKQFEEALKLLPDEREIPDLLRSISQMGTDSKLELRLISPQPENAKDFYMEIPVSLEVKGDYRNVTLFFDRVGRMDRIVNILNISMKPEKALSTDLITKCTAITYRFKGEDDVKKEAEKKKTTKKKKKKKKR